VKVALNLGCGRVRVKIDGYKVIGVDINPDVNPDVVADARSLPYDKESIDLIYASHLLEHFRRSELYGVLKHWRSLLKPGGVLYVIVPDLEQAAIDLLSGMTTPYTWDIIYGTQTDGSFHYSGFTPNSLKAFVEKYGFKVESIETREKQIFLTARKLDGGFIDEQS